MTKGRYGIHGGQYIPETLMNALKSEEEVEKPLFTDSGKQILQWMRDNQDQVMVKSRDIAEGLFISSRAISGSMRKLVSDGFVEDADGNKVKLIIDKRADFPIYMNLSEGKYIKHENDIYKDMFYIEEEKRGFYPKENHSVVGVYEINLQPNEEKTIFFTCGLESNIENINVDNMLKNEKNR